MTRNRARKQAVRAAAGEGGYARTARMHAEGSRAIHTADVQRTAVQAFHQAGWPTESDGFPEGGQWSAYAGPVWSLLSRPGTGDTEAHPDDADHHDLTITPAFTFIAPPISINTGEAMVLEVPGDTPPPELVSQMSAAVARARESEIAKLVIDAQCAICGNSYPARYLLAPPAPQELTVCPALARAVPLFRTGHAGRPLPWDRQQPRRPRSGSLLHPGGGSPGRRRSAGLGHPTLTPRARSSGGRAGPDGLQALVSAGSWAFPAAAWPGVGSTPGRSARCLRPSIPLRIGRPPDVRPLRGAGWSGACGGPWPAKRRFRRALDGALRRHPLGLHRRPKPSPAYC